MSKKNLLVNLFILNLILLAIVLFFKVPFLLFLIKSFIKVIFLPIIIGAFLYYLIRPLRNFLLNKGIPLSFSVAISLIMALAVLSICIFIISSNVLYQLSHLINRLNSILDKLDIYKFEYIKNSISRYVNINEIQSYISSESNNYLFRFGGIIRTLIDFGWNIFANIILFLLISFYLLKDDKKFKKYLTNLSIFKDKKKATFVINQCDNALSRYIIGQSSVALSLSSLVFLGYWLLNFPGKLILALSTFILGFIPFIGFFISMIVPYIIAITIGFPMILKLTLMFMIAQTIKGRLIVPFIMSRAMKIHPLTDIFLVIGAATLFGVLGAFLVVPIYSIAKILWTNKKIKLD